MNPGPGAGPVVHGVIDQPRVTPHADALAGGVEVRLVGHRVLVVADLIAGVGQHLKDGDAHVGFVAFLPVRFACRDEVEQGLAKYKTAQGSHRIEPPRHLPPGEAYVETECPRGQMGFYVVGRNTKDAVPLRVRARSSSFCNLSVTNAICKNCLIADIPAIVGSIDIVMGEIDR